ncbi:hypothetical protein TGARI_224250 [Toxoplasma gondii ARI]|uniref:Uncharacterized protein n=1 Tax=Toxoplasma gondii ARI TaxID=1074872 RepID=A0A139XTT1_TOXGO|nr:hypothetical protein TGARI_224250 [Toxoplasma gondii ARI]
MHALRCFAGETWFQKRESRAPDTAAERGGGQKGVELRDLFVHLGRPLLAFSAESPCTKWNFFVSDRNFSRGSRALSFRSSCLVLSTVRAQGGVVTAPQVVLHNHPRFSRSLAWKRRMLKHIVSGIFVRFDGKRRSLCSVAPGIFLTDPFLRTPLLPVLLPCHPFFTRETTHWTGAALIRLSPFLSSPQALCLPVSAASPCFPALSAL